MLWETFLRGKSGGVLWGYSLQLGDLVLALWPQFCKTLGKWLTECQSAAGRVQVHGCWAIIHCQLQWGQLGSAGVIIVQSSTPLTCLHLSTLLERLGIWFVFPSRGVVRISVLDFLVDDVTQTHRLESWVSVWVCDPCLARNGIKPLAHWYCYMYWFCTSRISTIPGD